MSEPRKSLKEQKAELVAAVEAGAVIRCSICGRPFNPYSAARAWFYFDEDGVSRVRHDRASKGSRFCIPNTGTRGWDERARQLRAQIQRARHEVEVALEWGHTITCPRCHKPVTRETYFVVVQPDGSTVTAHNPALGCAGNLDAPESGWRWQP